MRITEAAGLALAAAVLYMLPAILACARKSPRTGAITAVNACLGWTIIGWAFALRMTFSAAAAARPGRDSTAAPDDRARLSRGR